MTDKIHTWEFEWYNGEDWEECELYTTVKDEERVCKEFMKQNREMGVRVCGDYTVTYEGYGVNHSGLWVDEGEVKINNVCF